MHRELFTLGTAATVEVDIDDRGARVASTVAAPGWKVVKRRPRRWARRRPSNYILLYVRRGPIDEWELELNQLLDGSWEAAVVEQWPDDHPESIATLGGTARFWWDDTGLHLGEVRPAAGWGSRVDVEEGKDAWVWFSRGKEDCEAVVMTGWGRNFDQTVAQRGHNWRLALGPTPAGAQVG